MPRRGRLVVVSGPSGVGKSSVVAGVRRRTGAAFSVSVTTRPPRPGERNGVDYWFVDDETFDQMIDDGALLEWADYGGYRYGTPRTEVVRMLEAGRDVILDIENEGAKQVKRAYPDAVTIFILPPNRAELERRLRARGDTSPRDVERRLAIADAQIAEAPRVYDHLVVNDDLDTAIDEIVSILAPTPARARRDGAPGEPRTRSTT